MNDLSIVMRQMCVYAERHLAEFNLGFPEMVMIMYLANGGASNQESIAQAFELTRGPSRRPWQSLRRRGW